MRILIRMNICAIEWTLTMNKIKLLMKTKKTKTMNIKISQIIKMIKLKKNSVSILLIGFLLVNCFNNNKGSIVLHNEASTEIVSCTVEICNESYSINNIAIDGKRELEYLINGDCSFNISIQFTDGQELIDEIGYVTSGFNFKDVIYVYKDSLTIERISVN